MKIADKLDIDWRNAHYKYDFTISDFLFQGDEAKKGKKKKSAELVELPIDVQLPGNTEGDLQKFREEEVTESNLLNTSQLDEPFLIICKIKPKT